MKKLLLALSIVLLLLSCNDNLDYSKLPETNINNYISGNSVTFPKNTTALQVYDTVVFLSPDSDIFNTLNGRIENGEMLYFNIIKYRYSTIGVRHYYSVYFYNNSSLVLDCATNWGYYDNNQINSMSEHIKYNIYFEY